MKTAKLAFALPGLLACAMPALNLHAQTSDSPSYHPFTIGPEIGTTGYGGTGSFRFISHLGVTGGFDYFNYTENGSIKDVTYNAKLRLESEPVALSLYPSADSSFHLNLGVVFNQFRLTGTNPGGTFTLNGNTYAGTLNLNIQQQPVSPYISIAGNFFYFDHGHHVSIGGELGAMYTGTPRVGLTSSNSAADNDVATERQQLIKYANYGKFWPIVKLGLNISF
jgi:hypothetical protein